METEIFKFKLRGKTLAIIDWSNVYGWFSEPKSKTYLGWEVDPQKLFGYLKSYSEIIDIRFYYGTESDKTKSVVFQEEIKNYGYNSITKEVKWVPAALETTAHFKSLVHRLFDVLDNVKNKMALEALDRIKKQETLAEEKLRQAHDEARKIAFEANLRAEAVAKDRL